MTETGETDDAADRAGSAILLAGPTASGKSAYALDLAERMGGTVINADSMQVYAELRVLTARPTPADEARVPHRLYGHVPVREDYSVGRWLAEARATAAEARRAGRIPVFVGGTGLYFKTLTEGLSPIPSVPATVRQQIGDRLVTEGAAALHRELARHDPATADRVPPTDSQRITRALEVLVATGQPLSDWQTAPREGRVVDPGRARRFVLWPDRETLRARIDARVSEMIAAGALDEAAAVMELGLASSRPAARAHGLRPLIAHLRGEISLAEAAERTRAETRRYAKRQMTWFRHQAADWDRLPLPAP